MWKNKKTQEKNRRYKEPNANLRIRKISITKIKSSLDELNSRMETTKQKCSELNIDEQKLFKVNTGEKKTGEKKECLKFNICDTRIPARENKAFSVIKISLRKYFPNVLKDIK